MDGPDTSVAPVPLVEATVAMVVSTTMGQDQIMGIIYVSTVTTSIEVYRNWRPPSAVDCQGTTVMELREEDLVEGQP